MIRLSRKAWSMKWLPPLLLFVFLQVALLGPLLWSDGIPKGVDANASLVAGYDAINGSWDQIWDDSRAPGSPKHVARFTSSELALTALTRITGDLGFSARFIVWALANIAAGSAYFLVLRMTGSQTGAVIAALLYSFGRASGLQGGIPLAAGYALAPLLFLALDDALNAPRRRATVWLGLATAALVTSTVPPFTYVVGGAAVAYVAAFTVSRLWRRVKHDEPITPTMVALVLLGGGAVALAVSAYFVTGLAISTLPLVRDSGGYSPDILALRVPDLTQALALNPPGFLSNSMVIDLTAWAAVAFAGLVVVARPDYRNIALGLVLVGTIALASGGTSAWYGTLTDNVPMLDFVRGANKWLAVSQLAGAVLAGAGFVICRDFAPTLRLRVPRFWRPTAVGFVILLVAAFVAAHLGAVREWRTPYEPPDGVVDAITAIQGDPGTGAIAVLPFLESRLTGSPYISAIEFGRTLAPGISGEPVFGGFRAGGMEINSELHSIVSPLETNPISALRDVALSPVGVTLGTLPSDFTVLADISIASVVELDAHIEFRFGPDDPEDKYLVLVAPEPSGDAVVSLARGLQELIVASAPAASSESANIKVKITKRLDRLTVAINGLAVLNETVGTSQAATLGVRALGMDAAAAYLETLGGANNSDTEDASRIELLGLFGVERFAVMPYVSAVELERVSSNSAIRPNAGFPTLLLDNTSFRPGALWFSNSTGLFSGPASLVLPQLFTFGPIVERRVPLVALSDGSAEMRANAAFVALAGDASSTTNDDADGPDQIDAPHVYSYNVEGHLLGDTSPYLTSSSLLSTGPIEVVEISKEFVFAADFSDAEGRPSAGKVVFSFLSAAASSHLITFDRRANAVTLDREPGMPGGGRVQIAAALLPPSIGQVNYRIAVVDDLLTAYQDGRLVFSHMFSSVETGGPVVMDAGGAWITDMARSTSREGAEFLATVRDVGLDVAATRKRLPSLGRDHLGLFPHTQGAQIAFRGYRAGTYQIVAAVDGENAPTVFATLSDGTSSGTLEFEAVDFAGSADTVSGELDPAVMVSNEFVADGQPITIFIGAQGLGVEFTVLLIVESGHGQPEMDGFIEALRSDEAARGVSSVRIGATRFESVGLPADGGVLVFNQSYNSGWRLQVGGDELEPFPVFGVLNGFEIPASTGPGQREATLVFAPQRAYTWGLWVSFVSLACVTAWLALTSTQSRRRRQTPSATQANG